MKKRIWKKADLNSISSAEVAYRVQRAVERAGLTLVESPFVYENCFQTENERIP